MAAMVLPCAMFTACGGDDDEFVKEDTDKPTPENKIIKSDFDGKIDDSFVPTTSYIQKIWVGEYQGWDAVQQKNTTIRRRLTLNANGTYKNEIAGKLIESGKNEFFKFEAEGGRYTYNNGVVTYTCEYDSVLNYGTQSYTKYNKKHYYSKEETSYTEIAKFSDSRTGNRLWITKDMYLQSLTAEVLDLIFAMSEYNGDNQQDQNK